ncbi:ADP-ribosylglycohydrolase family protein, partial [Candidatus Gracilibacteria bacterium]|nr:ADP-ribosylglycohydrolase family protein [Candidatus Gracilibacteria bacterium]
MPLPHDYVERAYAGVLGKLIGVYLGRPFEGWTYERIMAELGEIWYYVHEQRRVPLIVTDDDISGTFTFLRALPDHGNTRELSPAQIGQTWLNYIIEGRTILWWGGLGNSTEHTAYLRLKRGVQAPESGSIARNGQVVAEQIGAQIFIDGWAMVAPGDPELAADLARRAASVSHDGEAIYGAQLLAAMEAQAFVERDLNALLDTGLRFIPRDSTIARMVDDLRDWHAELRDWRETRARIAADYGYDQFGGNCHMVPNHALIHLGLLYGEDDLQRALMITNTAGWDTDCNSGNVGCLLGIKNGLAGIDSGPDWRGPLADRLYLPTADGGRAISDAVRETYAVVNIGRALAGEVPLEPKGGARFHFELPGSVQGFQADERVDARGTLQIENVSGHSQRGKRSLALRCRGLAPGRVARALTATFIPLEAIDMPGYSLLASPTLYPGQQLRAALEADASNPHTLLCHIVVQYYGAENKLTTLVGPQAVLKPGERQELQWRIPNTGGCPIATVGIQIAGTPHGEGSIYLDELHWHGAPDVLLCRPASGGTMWQRAWVDGVDQSERGYPETYRLVQNAGTGLLMQGTREWTDYVVSALVTPHMMLSCGIVARCQGMRCYVALTLGYDEHGDKVLLLSERRGAEQRQIGLPFAWEYGQSYQLRLELKGARSMAEVRSQESGVRSQEQVRRI